MSAVADRPPSPGLVDLHIHGAFGVDVLTAGPAELDRLARGLAARGVSVFFPTLVPVPLPEMAAACSRLSSWMRTRREGDGRGAFPGGIHFEGPFVSRARCGALHPGSLLDGEDGRSLDAFLEAAGPLPGRPVTTVAPEIPGGLALVRALARRGFLVSLGHTEADAATLDEAFSAGARHMTHFGNALAPLHHRAVGPIGWGLLREDVTVDVIADLHHLSPEMLRLVFKAKPDRVALISDAIPPAGLPDGPYAVWGETLTVSRGTVRNARGNLAGSVCLLDEALRRAESAGVAREEAFQAARDVPARILASG